jgi:hypothetical protein
MYFVNNAEGNSQSDKNSSSKKFPVWAMIVAGIGGLLLLGLFVLFMTKGFKMGNMGKMGKMGKMGRQKFGFQFY